MIIVKSMPNDNNYHQNNFELGPKRFFCSHFAFFQSFVKTGLTLSNIATLSAMRIFAYKYASRRNLILFRSNIVKSMPNDIIYHQNSFELGAKLRLFTFCVISKLGKSGSHIIQYCHLFRNGIFHMS